VRPAMFACCAASPRSADADRLGVGRALPQSPIVETEAVVPPAPAAAPLAAAPTPSQQPAAGDGEAPAAASEAAATPVDERDPVPALVPVAATAPQAAPGGGAAVQSDAIATSVTTTAPAPAPAATQPPAFVGDEDAVKQPLYAEWMKLYEQSRNTGEFERVVVFIETNPSAVNNRKGGAFNERLHPATPSLHVQYRSAMAVPSRACAWCSRPPNAAWSLYVGVLHRRQGLDDSAPSVLLAGLKAAARAPEGRRRRPDARRLERPIAP
jgi:hypothetical protein